MKLLVVLLVLAIAWIIGGCLMVVPRIVHPHLLPTPT